MSDNLVGKPQTLIAFEVAFAQTLGILDASQNPAETVRNAKIGNPISADSLVPSEAEWAEKLVSRATAGADLQVKNSSERVELAKENAKKAENKWALKVQEAVAQKKFGKGVDKINTSEMAQTIRDRGASAFTSGLTARTAKIKRTVSDLRPKVVALKATIAGMPDDTDAQREARLLAARKGMLAIGKSLRGIA